VILIEQDTEAFLPVVFFDLPREHRDQHVLRTPSTHEATLRPTVRLCDAVLP